MREFTIHYCLDDLKEALKAAGMTANDENIERMSKKIDHFFIDAITEHINEMLVDAAYQIDERRFYE